MVDEPAFIGVGSQMDASGVQLLGMRQALGASECRGEARVLRERPDRRGGPGERGLTVVGSGAGVANRLMLLSFVTQAGFHVPDVRQLQVFDYECASRR